MVETKSKKCNKRKQDNKLTIPVIVFISIPERGHLDLYSNKYTALRMNNGTILCFVFKNIHSF